MANCKITKVVESKITDLFYHKNKTVTEIYRLLHGNYNREMMARLIAKKELKIEKQRTIKQTNTDNFLIIESSLNFL